MVKNIPEMEIPVKAGSREVLWLYGDNARDLHGWRMGCVGNVAGHRARGTSRDQSGRGLGEEGGLELVVGGKHHENILSWKVTGPGMGLTEAG